MSQSYDLSKDELERYSRHLNLPDFSECDQCLLKSTKVLVVGAGGLGSPLLQYLAAAGIGHIGIVEYDVIELSNLQRQTIYSTKDLGKKKSGLARERVLSINPEITVQVYDEPLTAANAFNIITQYDIVADGTDNFPTRYLINDACVLKDKVNVHASVFRYQGQVSVFNLPEKTRENQRGPNYRDLFPQPPDPEDVMSCEEGGILGVLPGIIGSIQALEVIKVVLEKGEILSGRLFLFDALTLQSSIVKFEKDPKNPLTGTKPDISALINYEEFCGVRKVPVPLISPALLMKRIKDPQDLFAIIDVRENHERESFHIGGLHLPLSQVNKLIAKVKSFEKVVVYCKSGKRSARALSLIRETFPDLEIHSLEGGTDAWLRIYGTKLTE